MLLDPIAIAESLPPSTPPEDIRKEYQKQLWALLHHQLDAVIAANGGDLELAALAGKDLRVAISDEQDESSVVPESVLDDTKINVVH